MTNRKNSSVSLICSALTLGAGVALAAPQQAAAAPPQTAPNGDYNAAREAQELIQDELFQFASVHAVGIGYCDKWWAHTLLGKDIPPEAPNPQIGVSISFADETELLTFARTSLILGTYVATSQGDVPLCADLREPATPQPVSGGSSQ